MESFSVDNSVVLAGYDHFIEIKIILTYIIE